MKHRNWSRLLATMLAGAMVLGLTACQTAAPQPAASTGTAESAPAAEAEAEAPAEEITLTITQWSQPSDDEERNIYKQFEKTHPGYKIDVQVIAEDQYSAKINQMISAGNAPDIVLAWECDLPTFAANKKVIALDVTVQWLT